MTDRQHAATLANTLRAVLAELEFYHALDVYWPAVTPAIEALAAWDRHANQPTDQQLPLTGGGL